MSEAKNLREFRIQLRLSQKELADLLGMKRWIANWERGRYPTPPYVWLALEKLAHAKKVENHQGNGLRAPRRRRLASAR